MDIDGLKSSWQNDSALADAAPVTEIAPLMERLSSLERDVHRRDVREYVAACAVMAFSGWRAATTDELLIRIGCLIVVLGSMFIIVWSRRASVPARRAGFAGDLPMVQFCARELEKVEAQIRLLKSAWWWYVAPTIVGVLLTLMPGSRVLWMKLLAGAVVVAVGVAIAAMNRVTARRDLEPLRDEIRERMRDLEGAP